MPGYGDRVFINVPLDRRYKKLFDALVFAVHDCGFVARCALESDDGSRCLTRPGRADRATAAPNTPTGADCYF